MVGVGVVVQVPAAEMQELSEAQGRGCGDGDLPWR